jgi:hypothetical protein
MKYFALVGIVVLVLGAAGCKPKSPGAESTALDPAQAPAHGYFKTPFQSESQFIVEAVVSDLAEQIYYAANHRLPDPKEFRVVASRHRDSPIDSPVYGLKIQLDRQHAELRMELKVDDCIWSPSVYREVAATLGKSVGLGTPADGGEGDARLISELLEQNPEVIEQANENLSAALEKDFTNPRLHEQAALLLGAFSWREHSGNFWELRSPLSRITAHLAMAELLRREKPEGPCGGLAEAMMLTLVNDGAPALAKLKSLDAKDADVAAMIRALQTRNTGDFRILADVANRSPMESVAWFAASADYVDVVAAWSKLDEAQKRTIDFVRAMNEEPYSVEIGHALLQVSVPLELGEIKSLYQLSRGHELAPAALVDALNVLPERCFTTDARAETHVRVIGWGQWAMFLQRQLCHAIQQNYLFLNAKWGVPDDAKQFAAGCEKEFGGLRLYPFVRRFTCSDVASYHKSVDDGFAVTVATPQLVPAQCWNYLCYKVPFAPLYNPNPNPHINEWHDLNPPPGTVYDLHPRLNHPSLIDRADAMAKFEHLHELAPCDTRITDYLLGKKYNRHPTLAQALEMYHDILPYSITALRTVAAAAYDQPEQYEKYMQQAAALNPAYNYDLGNYALAHNQEEQAAFYTDKACEADGDAVRASSHAEWRVRYYLKHGNIEKAREIADGAGEVYSFAGLSAKASFFEATSNYDDAFEWYAKIEERYNQPGSLMAFCQRFKALTGSTRFDEAVQTRIKRFFPHGLEKVTLKDFQTPPVDGVVFADSNSALREAGLATGDVVVALAGVRTHNLAQFSFVRDSMATGELDLLVWHGQQFIEVKASPPNRRFGVLLTDYQSK